MQVHAEDVQDAVIGLEQFNGQPDGAAIPCVGVVGVSCQLGGVTLGGVKDVVEHAVIAELQAAALATSQEQQHRPYEYQDESHVPC